MSVKSVQITLDHMLHGNIRLSRKTNFPKPTSSYQMTNLSGDEINYIHTTSLRHLAEAGILDRLGHRME